MRETETGEAIAATENATDREVKLYEFTSRPSRGAASEMLACAHLLTRGYHVFRSVSPACPVDLIAYRDAVCVRVEVKTVTITEYWRPELREVRRSLGVTWPRNDEWDLLLVAGPDQVHEFWAPVDRAKTLDLLYAHYGLPPRVPCKRSPRGQGKVKEPKNPLRSCYGYAVGSEWV